jgi:hypothetical protein
VSKLGVTPPTQRSKGRRQVAGDKDGDKVREEEEMRRKKGRKKRGD